MDAEQSLQPKADWQLAQALYLRHSPLAQIVREAHLPSPAALNKKIWRAQWKLLRQRAEAASQPGKLTLAERSAAVREALAADLQVTTAQLPELKRPASVDGFAERAQAVATVAGTAKHVFNWGESASKITAWDISLLDNCRTVELNDTGAAINVESTPMNESDPNPAPDGAVCDGEGGS